MRDTYNTIITPTEEILYKEKGSKFYAYAFPMTDSNEVSEFIAPLRKKHPKANHHCYAWKIGPGENNYRANDDGEPSHSAGDPILGQINAYDLSDILVVVTRIFGGTKLGVGGLIHAYRESAQLALKQAQIVERVITNDIKLNFEYPQMSQVMRFIDEHSYQIKKQELTAHCNIVIAVPLNEIEQAMNKLKTMYPIQAKMME